MFRSFIYLDQEKMYSYLRQIDADYANQPVESIKKKTRGGSFGTDLLGVNAGTEIEEKREVTKDVIKDYDRFEKKLEELSGSEYFDLALDDYDINTVPRMSIVRVNGSFEDRFLKSMIMLPPVDEQKKIDDIIACCDSRISLQERKIVEKEKLYNKYINKVVSGQTKYFRKDNTWKRMTLADVFEYIQPSKYIVKNTEYNDDFKIPVLTAGKTFILGYINETDGIYTDVPVVIFDDFTTDMQYVDFDFKVKSSAMKILKIKKEYDILFMFYTMRTLNYKVGAHERQWISKYSKLEIDVPPLYAQKQMARIFDEFRKELELERKLLLEYQKEKNAIIQLILSGYIRIR